MSKKTVKIQKKIERVSSLIQNLPTLNISDDVANFTANFILNELGDMNYTEFYQLVSQKIPQVAIRRSLWIALSGVKTDGATNPLKVFVHNIKTYAQRRVGDKAKNTENN